MTKSCADEVARILKLHAKGIITYDEKLTMMRELISKYRK